MNFFEEFQKLRLQRPRPAILNQKCVNSEYTNYTGNLKNCYLSFGDADEEDCFYTRWCFRNKDCADIDNVEDCELAYECLDCSHCYSTNFCQDCKNCTDCDLCYSCRGCEKCIGCVNLKQKKYYLFNQPVTKEVYEKAKKDLWKYRKSAEEKFQNVQRKEPRIAVHQVLTENCTGDYIWRSKNCNHCFDTWDCEDSMYLLSANDLKDCLDTNFIAGKGSELNYELMGGWYTSNAVFSSFCWYSYNVEYCDLCFNSHDLFGCVGLNHKEYCILNEQYSREAYQREVETIKTKLREDGLYGRKFYPSAFPHEDSLASLFYPNT